MSGTASAPTVDWAPSATTQPIFVAASAEPGVNGLAVASLVLSLCGLAVLPIIFGHIALVQLRRGGRGYGLAVAGVVIGYLTLAAWIAGLLLIGGTALWAVNA